MTGVRLDKWLWAARFFKTRTLAAKACELGRVKVNGQPVKPAREVHENMQLVIDTPGGVFEVRVLGLSDTRGSAPVAQGLYEESESSKRARAKAAEDRRVNREPVFVFPGRPSKRDRRELERLTGRGEPR